MKILFVHQNFPGQFVHLAPALQARGHEITVITDKANRAQIPFMTGRYAHEIPPADPKVAGLARQFTDASNRGLSAARIAYKMRDEHGYTPDLIFGHSGWGETLFLKEVWPEAKLIIYAEFFYKSRGADVGFDPEFAAARTDSGLATVARAAHLGHAMLSADAAVSPTKWQASTFPKVLQPLINVIFDGTNTERLRPDPAARYRLPSGAEIAAGDEVLTFINRNLEPYRGFHSFMRALPQVLRARPEAQVVLIGGDEVSYGGKPTDAASWKEKMLRELDGQLDLNRVHFLGKVPYADFITLMQVSRVHAYLTYPFVLSWSMLEAMAAGVHLIASCTAPVEEFVIDGVNGQLVDFFDIAGWSDALIAGLAEPRRFDGLRHAARESVVQHYDLGRHCLPRMVALVEAVGRGEAAGAA